MTLQREYQNGPFVVQCNTCEDTEELEGNERPEAIADAKSRGYTAHFNGRRWTCAYCTKQAQLLAFRRAEDRYEQYAPFLRAA